MILSSCASSSQSIRSEIEHIIFPTPYSSESNAKAVDPTDVPEGSMRALLIKCMISVDTSIKRTVAEFLYLLCDENGMYDKPISAILFGSFVFELIHYYSNFSYMFF